MRCDRKALTVWDRNKVTLTYIAVVVTALLVLAIGEAVGRW